MKVVQINGGVFGSTGKIMFGIADVVSANGNQVMCFSPVTKTNQNREPEHSYTKIGTFFSRRVCVAIDRITGLEGTSAIFQTISLLRRISEFNPEVIHLHSVHGSYLNLPMLFSFIKRRKIKLIWTLHDCWSFTGHCPHFEYVNCNKWTDGCYECPLYKEYPKSLFDNSKTMWKLKKKWFTAIDGAVIVTPSQWLASKVRKSYLKDYECRVINNGIDLSIFKPANSNFKEKYGIVGKYMILGVAFGWSRRKGLDVFIQLADRLPDGYQIVLVGTDYNVDKELPSNIISIHMTQNQEELAEIYTAADLFVNPTREETFGMVNIESLACGTPVITFDTGGSPEIIDAKTGSVIPKDDVDALLEKVIEISSQKVFRRMDCVERARKNYDKKDKYNEYAMLVDEILR